MKVSIPRLLSVPCLAAAVLLQAACSLGGPGRPSHFYALAPRAAQSAQAPPASELPAAGIGPIGLPELYQRPQIVSRPDENRVELAEFDRWGGALREEIQQVMLQNLMARLHSPNLQPWPWQRREAPPLQVRVQFFRFDGAPGQKAYLSGIWELRDARADCRLEGHRFEISRQPDGPGYPAYVGALSEALDVLSGEIAERLALAEPGCRS